MYSVALARYFKTQVNMKENTPVDSVATVNILLLPVTKDLFTTTLLVSVDWGNKFIFSSFLRVRRYNRGAGHDGRLQINDP